MSEGQQNVTGKLTLGPLKRGPFPACTLLIIRSDGMEPKRYKSLCDAARSTRILRQTLMYAHKNGKYVIMKCKGGGVKVFYVEWL